MRKVKIAILMGALLMPMALVGCSDTGTAGTAPAGAQEGPRPPEMPTGASDAMKKSLAQKPTKKARAGQSGQVPH